MHYSILTSLLAGLVVVNAIPVAEPVVEAETGIEKRDTVGVKYCVDENGGGACNTVGADTNYCQLVASAWRYKITSIYIYPAGYYCDFYPRDNCDGGSGSLHLNAGSTNNVGRTYNDKILSFTCGKY